MHGPIFTEWIHSICTQSKPYISTLRCKLWILKIKIFPLSSSRRVSNLLIILPTVGGAVVRGAGVEFEQDKFQSTAPPLLEIFFHAATVS
jgi:hypothetical protein